MTSMLHPPQQRLVKDMTARAFSVLSYRAKEGYSSGFLQIKVSTMRIHDVIIIHADYL